MIRATKLNLAQKLDKSLLSRRKKNKLIFKIFRMICNHFTLI